jgi:hypothetical protein
VRAHTRSSPRRYGLGVSGNSAGHDSSRLFTNLLAYGPPWPRPTITFDGNVDRITGSYEFGSNCDPFGTNPNGGEQFFAMRTDGSGLRQLTQTRGIVREADGTIEVEMPGPFAAPWRLR